MRRRFVRLKIHKKSSSRQVDFCLMAKDGKNEITTQYSLGETEIGDFV